MSKYEERNVEDWTVRDFHDYMGDMHTKKFGVTYQPGGGWRTEQGLIGDVVGTQKKRGQYDKAMIKEFVTRCMEQYPPTAKFPGINFMFMWTYKKNILQQVELDWARRGVAEETTVDEIDEEWF